MVQGAKQWRLLVLRRLLQAAARSGIAPRYVAAMRGYFEWNGSLPNLVRPRSFNEKLIARALRDRRPLLVLTADKAAVRDYVRERVGDNILTDVIFVGPHLDDFSLTSIDEPVVIKATHASGPDWMRIVTDPAAADWGEIRAAARRWATKPYQSGNHEWWYEHIPRQVMVERFVGDTSDGPPDDYKFFVINQTVEMVEVVLDRFGRHRRELFTASWERIDATYWYAKSDEPPPRPGQLEEMLDISRRLSHDFGFVRVDLYHTEFGVKFGELTHCPTAGYKTFSDRALDARLAGRIPVPPLAGAVFSSTGWGGRRRNDNCVPEMRS